MSELKNTYQEWYLMLAVAFLFSLPLFAVSILLTWELGVEWGHLDQHFQIWLDIAKEFKSLQTDSYERYREFIIRNNLQREFILHTLVPLGFSLILGLVLSFKWLYVKGGRDRAIHIAGPRLLRNKLPSKHSKKALRKELRQKKILGIYLHPEVCITQQQEVNNILVTGAQGSGKSTIIKPTLKQILQRGDSALIYDSKREYTETFLSKTNLLLNPTDSRSISWDIMRDVQTPEQARQIAIALIPEHAKDPFWSNGAREILTGYFIVLLNGNGLWSWPELKKLLDLPAKDIKPLFEACHPKAANLVEEDSKTTQGFISILSTELHWIDYVSQVWTKNSKNKFSIRRWVNGGYNLKGLIIANDPRFSSISKPLCSAVLAVLTDELLSFADNDRKKFWLVLDELADLPKTKSLEKWLALGRSKGARTLAGTQNISQLQQIYGDKRTETITSLFSNIVALKVGNSADTAKKVADNFGKRIVKRATVNFDKEGNKSTSYAQSEEYVVRPEQLTQLPSPDKKGVIGYLSIQGWEAVYELVWPYFKHEKVAEAYVPVKIESYISPEPDESKRRGSRGRKRTC